MTRPRSRSPAQRLLAHSRRELRLHPVVAVWVYGLLLWLVWLMLLLVYADTSWPDFGGVLVPVLSVIHALWALLLLGGVCSELGADHRRRLVRSGPYIAAGLLLVGLQIGVLRQSGLDAKLERAATTQSERILYIECWDAVEGQGPRVGRVRITEAGHRAWYREREFESDRLPWLRDKETGFRFTMHPVREDGRDGWGGERVEVDADVRREYWTEIRGRPDLADESSYEAGRSPYRRR